jgi:hypothetical protein
VFLKLTNTSNEHSLEYLLVREQEKHSKWAEEHGGQQAKGTTLWVAGDGWMLIPPSDELKRRIMHIYHDGLLGHLGRDETIQKVLRHFYWLGAQQWIEQYVKGCMTCQQNKNLTHKTQAPLYKIMVPPDTLPFTQIAMDLITGLPKSRGYDSILTIVDHGCSQGALFLPCQSTITGPQIAKLYYQHLYPWFGLPHCIITDRDPCFTSHFGKALAKELGITWNFSTAYHPQTDGLSERKNQWLKQYLRLVCGNQADWPTMLAIATLMHNNVRNSTTGHAPNHLITGLEPAATPDHGEGTDNPLAEERMD